MTRAELDRDRADAVAQLRERRGLSRTDYEAERRRIEHDHAGRLDALIRGRTTPQKQ